jgi:branched-chain amino acid transport system substrate-binding protein
VFGNISSYSGLLGSLTEGNKYGLSAWVSMQNARGGLDGHPIKLIIGDDQADPITGLTIEKRMVESDHILALVGNLNVFGVDQYADYAKSKSIPFIGGDGVGARWYTDPDMFPAVAPTTGAIEAGLRNFVNQGSTRLGMTYCLEVAKMCGYLNDVTVKSPVGKYIIDDEQVSLAAPSYTSQCLRMQAEKIAAVFTILDTAGAARFVQNCATQGYDPKFMVLSLDASPAFPKVDALHDAFLPGPTVPPSETQIPAVAEYRAAMDKFAPGIGDSGCSGMGWANGLVLGRAGVHLPDNPTAVDFEANLWMVKNDDLGGFATPLTFPKDKPAVASTCVFIWGVKDHKFYAPRGPKALC